MYIFFHFLCLDSDGEWSPWIEKWDEIKNCTRKERTCEKHCGDGAACPGDEVDNSNCNGRYILNMLCDD